MDTQKYKENIAKVIKSKVKGSGLTQEKFSEKYGLRFWGLVEIINVKRSGDLKLSTIIEHAKKADISIIDLLEGRISNRKYEGSMELEDYLRNISKNIRDSWQASGLSYHNFSKKKNLNEWSTTNFSLGRTTNIMLSSLLNFSDKLNVSLEKLLLNP